MLQHIKLELTKENRKKKCIRNFLLRSSWDYIDEFLVKGCLFYNILTKSCSIVLVIVLFFHFNLKKYTLNILGDSFTQFEYRNKLKMILKASWIRNSMFKDYRDNTMTKRLKK